MTKGGFIFIILIIVIASSIYVIEPDFKIIEMIEPPGCSMGFNLFGDCSGKNKIVGLDITGDKPNCLKIRANNCEVARLEIENTCAKNLNFKINGESFSDKFNYLRYEESRSGNEKRRDKDDYEYPTRDQNITLDGEMGIHKFEIKYIETKKACE